MNEIMKQTGPRVDDGGWVFSDPGIRPLNVIKKTSFRKIHSIVIKKRLYRPILDDQATLTSQYFPSSSVTDYLFLLHGIHILSLRLVVIVGGFIGIAFAAPAGGRDVAGRGIRGVRGRRERRSCHRLLRRRRHTRVLAIRGIQSLLHALVLGIVQH